MAADERDSLEARVSVIVNASTFGLTAVLVWVVSLVVRLLWFSATISIIGSVAVGVHGERHDPLV